MQKEKALSIRYIKLWVVIFEKSRTELEKDETMKDYGGSHFKAIFGDDQLGERMWEL